MNKPQWRMHVNTACIFEFAICHYGLVIQHLHFSFVNPDQGFDGVIARGHGFEPFRQLRAAQRLWPGFLPALQDGGFHTGRLRGWEMAANFSCAGSGPLLPR
jgi:hypothetical protein